MANWINVKVSDVLKIPQQKKEENPQNIELLTVQLHARGIKKSGKFPKPTQNGRPYFKRFKNEILIGRQNFHNGGIGKVLLKHDGLVASNAISSLVTKNKKEVDFFIHLFQWKNFYKNVENYIGGTGQKEISEKQLLEVPIKIPSIEKERVKIAQILTSVDRVIELTEKEIDKLKDLKKGMMQELLTKGIGHTKFKDSPVGRIPESWEVVALKEIIKRGPRNGYSPIESEKFIKLKILGLGCLGEDGFSPCPLKNAPLDEKLEKFILNEGDFLISRSNTRDKVGLSGVYRHHGYTSTYPDLLMRIKFKKLVNATFASHQFNYGYLRKIVMNSSQGTSGSMVKINSSIVKEYPFALPEIEEQNQITSIINNFGKNIMSKTKKLERALFVKKGLMQDLLTGKVRVKV